MADNRAEARRDMALEAPALIWASDAAGRLVYANRRCEAVFGVPAALLMGDGWHMLVVAADRPRVQTAFRAAQARQRPFTVTARLLTASGEPRWHRCEAVPEFDGAGGLAGYVGCATDVHAAREAEAALRELNTTLERRVAERTGQLAAEAAARAAAQDRLRHTQKLEALGQLAGGVAHDFNNASAAVLAGIALLEKRYAGALAAAGPGATRLLESLKEAAGRGADISRRLLAFARREELRASELNPAEVLHGLRTALASTLWPAVRIAVDAPGGLPAIRADRARLETTLINLAINARDAMPGGGTVTFGAVAETVGPASGNGHGGEGHGARLPPDLAPGRYVRLLVADTGTGMDAATLARATEPFFTTKPRDRGSGLGLSMADGFATQSGGAMRVDSAPGQGTTVTLWLPCVPGEPADLRDGHPAARRRALVVDDEPMMRRFLIECFRHEGWDVDEAEDAGYALARLEAGEPYDLLVTDLAMPGMDGAALIQAARLRQPDLPAIMLTGTGRMADMAPIAGRGGFALLRKPVSPTEFAESIQALSAQRPPVAR